VFVIDKKASHKKMEADAMINSFQSGCNAPNLSQIYCPSNLQRISFLKAQTALRKDPRHKPWILD
jgi:hypothetical protein